MSVMGWLGLGSVGCVAAANGSVRLEDTVEGLARGGFGGGPSTRGVRWRA